MTTRDVYKDESWGDAAAAYRAKVNTVTHAPAKRAVDMAVSLRPIDQKSHVIDVGSGAGVVTQYVAETTSAQIVAIDTAQGMLDVIKVPDGTRLEKKVLDAKDLSQAFPAGTFSHAFCTFVLHVVPDETAVLQEIRKVLQPDGVVAIAVWGQRMDNNATWEQACKTIDPSYELPAPMKPEWSWRTPQVLREKLKEAGFHDAQTTDEVLMPFDFASAEDWTRFAFEAKHPVEEIKLKTWKGDMNAVRKALLKVTKENFDDAKGMMASAVIAAARM